MAADQTPAPRTAAGLATAEDWRPFFAAYKTIVLVANSDEVRIDELRASVPADALFVFFNRVYKVLDRPFEAVNDILLATRSGPNGPYIVRRNEVGQVVGSFRSDKFLGIMCLTAGRDERFTPASAFGGVPTGHLDLAGYFADFYPADHLPSTGFAMAVWLAELNPEAKIMLAGFSGKRSAQWKIFHVHDWTYEQTVQRLLIRAGRLSIANAAMPHSYAALLKRFPELAAADLSLAAAEILAERIEHVNQDIDKLIATTRVNRSVDNFIRGFKPLEGVIRRFRRKLASKED